MKTKLVRRLIEENQTKVLHLFILLFFHLLNHTSALPTASQSAFQLQNDSSEPEIEEAIMTPETAYQIQLQQFRDSVRNQSYNSKPRRTVWETLDAMQLLMTGRNIFDRVFVKRLEKCMQELGSNVEKGQNAMWQGMETYWILNGTEGDTWGGSDLKFFEKNITSTKYYNMSIYEPCGYASNLAYYRVTTELCDRRTRGKKFSFEDDYVKAIARAFAAIAPGSAFMHGSHTELGIKQDVTTMNAMAYAIHRACVHDLPHSHITHDLRKTERKYNALQSVDELYDIYLNSPVEDWLNRTEELELPHYYRSFAATVVTGVHLVMEENRALTTSIWMMDALTVDAETKEFILTHYIAEIKKALQGIQLGYFESMALMRDIATVGLRIAYALVWQENVMVNYELLRSQIVNSIGGYLMPVISANLGIIASFEFLDEDFLSGRNIYPGEEKCNSEIPHAKWHVLSAISGLELVYVADDINKIIKQKLQL